MKFDAALHTTTERVLLVSEQSTTLRALAQALNYGPQLLKAKNREQMLEQLAGGVDLVLLDLALPDAESLLNQLDYMHQKGLPVILIVAEDCQQQAIAGLKCGAADFITAPLITEVVRARVAVHLELKKQQNMMRELATLDPLTGLVNRRLFERAMSRYWALLSRKAQGMTLMAIALEGLEDYYADVGHQKGDQLVVDFSLAIDRTLHRASDLACRFDFEFFLVALPDTELDAAHKLAAQISQQAKSLPDHVALSIGLAEVAGGSRQTPQTLIDSAMGLVEAAKAGQGKIRHLRL